MSEVSYVKLVIVPCEMDEDGRAVHDPPKPPPRGTHHILGVFEDGSYQQIASVNFTVSQDDMMVIARIMGGETPIEVDREFYKKYLSRVYG